MQTQPTRPACTAAEHDEILFFAAFQTALSCCAERAFRLDAYGLARLARDIRHDVETTRLHSYADR
jgi:hypothetical protein